MGFVLHQSGDRESAERYYERSLALKPKTGMFLEHLGRLYFEEKDFSRAVPLLKKAVQSGPVQPMTLALLGQAYHEVRDYQLALESFRHLLSIELIPEVEGVIRQQMVVTLCSMGNFGGARRACLHLIQTHRLDYDLLMQLCDMFLNARCISPAKEVLSHLVRRREEYLPARQKFQQLQATEAQIETLLPGIYSSEEEQALRHIGQLMRLGHEKIAKAFLSLRESDSALIRLNVVEYCCRFGYLSWGEIAEFLQDKSPLVRAKTAEYLVRFGPSSLSLKMAEALKDDAPVVRGHASRFLKQHGNTEVLPALGEALEKEHDPGTRIKIRAAMTAIQRRNSPRALIEKMRKVDAAGHSVLDRLSIWALCSLLSSVVLLMAWAFRLI